MSCPGAPSTPPKDASPRAWRRGLKWLLRIVGTAGLAAYLLMTADVGSVAEILGNARRDLLLAAILLYALDRGLAAAKWRILFRAHLASDSPDVSMWWAFNVYLRSSFLGAALPSTIGMDAVRSGMVRREAGSYAYAVSTVAVERLLGIVSLLACLAIGLTFVTSSSWITPEIGYLAAGVGLLLLVVILILLLPGGVLSVEHRPPRLVGRLLSFLKDTRTWIREYRRTPRAVLGAFGLALAQQYLFIALNWVAALSLGIAIPLHEMLWLWPVVMLATRIPVSILGFGVRETVLVYLLASGGIRMEAAVSLGLLSGFLDLVFIGIGGALVAGLGVGTNTRALDSD